MHERIKIMKAQAITAMPDEIADQYISRLERLPWERVAEDLDKYGAAVLPGLLSAAECRAMAGLSSDPALSPVPPVEAQSTWGNGDHRYLGYPMPGAVAGLRAALYARLVGIANDWNRRMEVGQRYPEAHRDYREVCRRAGQTLSTSMLMDHTVGQFSFLHQDLYGTQSFPLQAAILLSQPGADFSGGEFVITEQRPRMQTRPEVVTLNQGDAALFAVSGRPVTGSRGAYRVNLRHGFSKVRAGRLRALSIIFHDAAA